MDAAAGRDRRPGALRARHRLRQARRDARAHRATPRRRARTRCSIITPYYARPTQEGLFQWYDARRAASSRTCRSSSTTCRRAPPSTSRRRPSPRLRAKPRQHRRGQGDHQGLRALLPCPARARHGTPSCWSGIELLCLPLLALGGAGFVSAVANLAPSAVARMYEQLDKRASPDQARDLHFGCTRWPT